MEETAQNFVVARQQQINSLAQKVITSSHNQVFQTYHRSLSRSELRNRLFEQGQPKPNLKNQLTSLPSVVNTNKGKPLPNKGLQFRPLRSSSLVGNPEQSQKQIQIILNKKQSAFLAGASTAVQDPFPQHELSKLHIQRERMFQSIEDVQLEEDPGLVDENQDQLHFRVPSINQLQGSASQIPNLGKEWTQDLSTQLSRFKNSQNQKMFVKSGNTFTPATRIPTGATSQMLLPPAHPQYQRHNVDPYMRPQTQTLEMTQNFKGLGASQSIKNLGTLNTLTPSASSRMLPKKQQIPPSQSGQVPGSTLKTQGNLMAQSQSDVFFKNVRQNNKPIRTIKMIGDTQTSLNSSRRSSITQLPTIQVVESKNQMTQKIAQSEAAEEVLRQHYFIAKATLRTSQKQLEKEQSPQRHLSGSKRLKKLEEIQVQAASLMRLNAIWGLENKDKPMDIQKAKIDLVQSLEGGVLFDIFPDNDKTVFQQEETTDLEMMISLFMRQPQDNGYFIYLIQGDDVDNPFDLKPMIDYVRPGDKQGGIKRQSMGGGQSIMEIQSDIYYTLSKKGITTYIKGNPEGYEPLQDWILARSNFKVIRNYSFFKNFKKWKILKKWNRNMVHTKREEIKLALEEKLFILDETFGQVLMKHRSNCINLETLRIINLRWTSMQIGTLQDFQEQQEKQRQYTSQIIKQKSDISREFFRVGMETVIEKIKKTLKDQSEKEDLSLDIKQSKVGDSVSQQSNKRPNLYFNQALSDLGFTGQLKYGTKSELRQNCSRFLRFSYLMDFIATAALTNIYLNSVSETIVKLQELQSLPVDYSLVKVEDEDKKINTGRSSISKNSGTTVVKVRVNTQPFLQVFGHFHDHNVPQNRLIKKQIDIFQPPPLGLSQPTDFNPTCHLKLAEERVEEDDIDLATQEFMGAVETLDAYFVDRPDKLWLQIEPSCQKLQEVIHYSLLDGKQCLRTFVRWSRHPDLNKYQAVLETWDDRVCDSWDPLTPDKSYLNCDEWLLESTIYRTHSSIIDKLINQAYQKIDTFYEQYIPYLQQYWENKTCGEFEILKDERLYNPFESFQMIFQRFVHQKVLFDENLPDSRDIGMFRLDTTQIKEKFTPQPKNCVNILKNLVPTIIQTRINESAEWLKTQIKALQENPKTVAAYVQQIQVLEYIDMTYQDVKDRIDLNTQIFNLCVKYDIIGRQDRHRRFIDDANQLISTLNKEQSIAREMSSRRKDAIKVKIKAKVPKLNKITNEFLEELENPKYLDIESDLLEILEQIERNETMCELITAQKTAIQNYQRTLDMPEITQFNNADEAKHNHMYRARLWRALHEWQQHIIKWEDTVFSQIDVKIISEISEKYQKTVLQCEKNLPSGSTAVFELKRLVMAFKDTMPIVEALANQFLLTNHWVEIKNELDLPQDFPLEKRQMTLGKLIELRVARKQEQIIHISVTATQENNLLHQIEEIKAIWNTTEFQIVRYKDRGDQFKIIGIDIIQAVLDESLAKISEIQSNRYVKRHAVEVDFQQEKLIIMSETLEQWKECQRNWLYLDNVFSSGDIKKQRPKDFNDFDGINRLYCKLMKSVSTKPNVRKNCEHKQKLQDFIKYNLGMERIQKNLDAYLEEKRIEFPRFYFLSNDELLQLLAQAQDILEVAKHLNKCFDNLKTLIITDTAQSGNLPDIVAIVSNEGETLELLRVLKIRTNGEKQWLNMLEEEICRTILRKIKDAYNYQQKEQSTKKDWVLKHCCQAVSVSSMLIWTESTEYYIQDIEDNPFSMSEALKTQEEALKLLVDQIRLANLTSVQRKTLVSLITQEVHARDILTELLNEDIQSISDFKWQQQLRYYFEDDHVVVKQVNAYLTYGYEYMGATTRLVITPLTDKCWLTITGALHIKLSASPSGPAGTGKTESTKDLAKGLGYLCVVFNCSDQVEYKIMGRLFSGLAQTGAWACLDEFNRIEVEVLSVIAQQLMDIRQAKLQNKTQFNFNEQDKMILKQSCGVFVTMNPGYAGRTELPDNLKVLFRPVSMMIPSYQLIAEVMLFAEGFNDAKRLSAKMVKLYKLASEQLSQQDHYDFGMRAVKSVLVMAGNLKRQYPTESENVVLIRAMGESNVPKFLSEDLPLFQALIQDLFPGVELITQSTNKLNVQIEQSIAEKSLMKLDSFLLKVSQLNDTLLVRFGVMIVGPTGGSKTTCYQVLQHAINSLKILDESNQYRTIKTKVLNPKSISMGELYGQENKDTKEWTDGLLSKIIRKFATATDDRNYWVVLDGPVDALWIENLNTVLDDNMTLCLANGERIKLREQLRLLFEVQDLAVASPATVSRCGMVYMTPNDLGWKPYQVQWVQKFIMRDNKFPPRLRQDHLNLLNDMFDQFTDPVFERLQPLQAEQQLVCVPIQIITNMCNYLEYFLINTASQPKLDNKEMWIKYINAIFGYSMIWAFGANFKQSVNRFIDNIFRDFFSRLLIPLNDSVFEYYLDEHKCQFIHWKELVSHFVYPKEETPFFNLNVPTIDTMRYQGHLKMLCQISKPVFITGQTGTGKSMIVQNFINTNAEKMEFISIILNFSAQTDSASTQSNIEGKLEKKRKKSRGAKGTMKTLIFIDDINMPSVEQYGAQPPIELLRQLLDKGGFYDRQQLFWKEIEKFTIVSAAAPPAGGRSALCPRFMRQFHIFNVPDPSEETLTLIFESILGGFLNANLFNERVRRSQPSTAVGATIDLYTQITKTLLPIPAKFHYTFNLRDISKVFQGLLLTNPITMQDNDQFAKLWLHECQRVFADRLVDENDKNYFRNLAIEIVKQKFKATWATKCEEVFGGENEQIFTVIMKLDYDKPTYDLVIERGNLVRVLNDKLLDYNFSSSSKMNLVFFADAVNYLCAITRILQQPRGNAMLIGVSGSGKQSLTKLAAFMLDQQCFQLQLSKNFKPADFRDTIRTKMLFSGCEGFKTTFVLTDTQIMYESFLEDINNILNTGEITNLYQKEDFERMVESLQKQMTEKKIPLNKDNAYLEYIQMVRNNFHSILCMSPVGDKLRIRCRMFPSLVNCCTLIWFSSWPIEALTSVANKYLQEVQNVPTEILVHLFPLIHSSVEKYAEKFYLELRRITYITPKSFLDSIIQYLQLLKQKRAGFDDTFKRLENGVLKLNQTNQQIEELQIKLTELRPQLVIQEKNAQIQVTEIKEQKEIASKKEYEAEQDAMVVRTETNIIEALKKEAEIELSAATPSLEAATKAVEALSKDDVTELKNVKNPNAATEMALKCVLTYLGYQKYEWATAQKAMADMQFLQKLKTYDKENISVPIMTKVKNIITDKKEWNTEKITNSSKAAGGLAKWCVAVHKYAETLNIVRPKEQRVAEMQEKFRSAMLEVEEKQKIALEMKKQVQNMEADLDYTMNLIEKLKTDSDNCEKRLINAGKLINLLADEGKRWEQTIKQLYLEGKFIAGDVFLSCAELSYLGPFSGAYRDDLIKLWLSYAKDQGLEFSEKYSLVSTLGDQIQIREWTMSGLQSDSVSIDNAIMSTRTSRWPLMIDPQTQANVWIKKMALQDVSSPLIILKAIGDDQSQIQKKLEKAIQLGQTVLLEEVTENMDPSLDSIFIKSTFNEDGVQKIKFGDKSILYDDQFKFMLTTKIQNPHFLPEICIKLTVINFSITFEGLEDQMLVDVIKIEAPEVEEQRDTLIIQLAQSRNDLYKLQSKILNELAQSNSDTILDNVVLIETLEICSVESVKIVESLNQAESVEIIINEQRNKYRVTATRGSLIYFSIVELSLIDPMYQNSLTYVKKLFTEAIKSVQKSDQLSHEELIKLHIEAITDQLYRKICVGLFEAHKLIFAFLMCTRIQRQAKVIDPKEWSIFFRGADLSELQQEKEINWLTPSQWAEAGAITGLQEHLQKNQNAWYKYTQTQQLGEFPLDFSNNLTAFQCLLVVKILKTEVLQFAVQKYLDQEIGSQFAVSPASSIDSLFSDGDQYTPIIFILSQGVDPTAQIMQFSQNKGFEERFFYKSLGQGQEKIAEDMINTGMIEGNWILLQNCHLFKSWMPRLESICAELSSRIKECHTEFKLILTSMPVDYFPVSVLQNSLKMTSDPPKGIKANLQRTYTDIITEETYQEISQKIHSELHTGMTGVQTGSQITQFDSQKLLEKQRVWKLLLFSLAFFHAVVQERRKFGPHGWNIRYEFSDADLITSITMLKNFLQDNNEIPWDSIKFMTGQINYGGRVTDYLDGILMMNILNIYQNEDIILTEAYTFSRSGIYRVPAHSNVDQIINYINTLPNEDPPEIFGMHHNANLTYLRAKSQLIIETILSVQPRQYTGTQGKSSDEQVIEIATVLVTQVPEIIANDNFAKEILKTTPQGLLSCLSTVLLQEIQRYNRLIVKLSNSLELLIKAVKGVVLMSQELDIMYTALMANQVPQNWQNVAYPSLKKLTSWMSDLNERVNFMRNWAIKGHPKSYWLSGFFFPHGFITSVLQNYSRKYQQPIDQLSLSFEIKSWQSPDEVDREPKEGVYIYGLFLENAHWNKEQQMLQDPLPGEMSFIMPIIHFIPKVEQTKNAKNNRSQIDENSQDVLQDFYQCPVYKTSLRAGVLSTTGQSTNFILSVDLPCGTLDKSQKYTSNKAYGTGESIISAVTEDSIEHWTLRGTAMLTMLAD